MIGDVAGHGPDEAALGVALRIGWRALTFAGLRGNERMRQLERLMFAERPGKAIFATLLSVALAPDSLRFNAVRAGHPGMLVHGPDDVQWLEPPAGPALGLGGTRMAGQRTGAAGRPRPAAAHRRTFRGPLGTRQRTSRRGRTTRGGPFVAALPGRAFVDALIEEAEARARAHGGLTDDIAVVRVERITR